MLERQGVPDIYADQVAMLMTEWGLMLALQTIMPPSGRFEPTGESGESVALPEELMGIVRLTHPHAKTLVILLKRILKAYEEQAGEIQIPPTQITRHNITAEEWA